MKYTARIRILTAAMPFAGLLVAWLLGAAPARAAGSDPWPDMPLPPKSKVEWIADSMRVNGVPMRAMRFESSAGRAEIVEYYRSYWSGGYPTKPSVRTAGDAIVVGQAHGPYFMTVKVNDAPHGASEGLISVSRVVGSKVERSPGELPLMPGAKVMQVVESNDPGKHSREVLISSPAAGPSVVQYYQAALSDAGWHQVQYNDTSREAGGPQGSFLVFLRERSEVQLSVVAGPGGGGSVLAAALVTKDTVPQAF
jgi:hypothetical protein